MLRGIPKCLSPELLKVLAEMGHGDTLIIADAFYPSASSARHSMLVRADGVSATELMDAILTFFPLDRSVEHPVLLMDKQECDKDIPTPIWDKYKEIVRRHDDRGDACVGLISTRKPSMRMPCWRPAKMPCMAARFCRRARSKSNGFEMKRERNAKPCLS